MEYKKRGQVTVFILIAIVLVIIGISYLVLNDSSGISLVPERQVKTEFVPVKAFVDECVKNAADEGITRIGMSGGYINVPHRFTDPRAHVTIPRESGIIVPYWWYSGQNSYPTLSFIDYELESYIKESSLECIDEFKGLENYNVEVEGDFEIDVGINEGDVSVEVEYPLNVLFKQDNSDTKIKRFRYNAPVRLKKVYEAALAIIEAENRDGFIERKTFDLMVLKKEDDVPINGFEPAVPCRERKWNQIEVRDTINRLVDENIGKVKIVGTDFSTETYFPNPCLTDEYRDRAICQDSDFTDDTYASSYYMTHYVWDVGEVDSNLKVSFRLGGDFDRFNVEPSSGVTLKSSTQSPISVDNPILAAVSAVASKFICFNNWHFTYDISYPIVVSVIDQPTENNERYLFNFGFAANLDNNRPLRDVSRNSIIDAPASDTAEDYCGETTRGQIHLRTKDEDGNAVSGVDLRLNCGTDSCDVGESKFDEFNLADPNAKWDGNLPRCVSGTVTAIKEGYLDASVPVIVDNRELFYDIEMREVKEFPDCGDDGCDTTIQILKHRLKRPNLLTQLRDNTKELFEPETNVRQISDTGDEQGIIFLRDWNSDFTSSAMFPIEREDSLTVLKYPTKYEIEVILLEEDVITGGFKGNWTTQRGDIHNGADLRLHVVDYESLNSLPEDQKQSENFALLDNIEFFSEKLTDVMNRDLPELR